MAENPRARAEARVRATLRRFLRTRNPARYPLGHALKRIAECGWNAAVFGGMPRDLVLFGSRARIRDVDIVVDGVGVDQIVDAFGPYVRRRTRFGGVSLNIQGWRFDIWPLQETWAFRERKLPLASFADLPKTTFLDVEALAITVSPKRRWRVHSHGFFDAATKRVVDINLEENPYPDLAIVRSLLIAANLRFALGPRLKQYIALYSEHYSSAQLSHVQQRHYGWVRRRGAEIAHWINAVRLHTDRWPCEPFLLPGTEGEQLEFWGGTNWEFAIDSEPLEASSHEPTVSQVRA
jgi:hypothetical protein